MNAKTLFMKVLAHRVCSDVVYIKMTASAARLARDAETLGAHLHVGGGAGVGETQLQLH